MLKIQHKNQPLDEIAQNRSGPRAAVQFKTTDLLMLFGSVAIIATLSGVIMARGLQDQRPDLARSSAEAFALQLAQNFASHQVGQVGAAKLNSRRPASVEAKSVWPDLPLDGQLGKDPWGQPFHYHVQEAPISNLRRVYVWSSGPNRQLESVVFLPDSMESDGSRVVFKGDDVGYVHEEILDRTIR
jgi:hypothetical protein